MKIKLFGAAIALLAASCIHAQTPVIGNNINSTDCTTVNGQPGAIQKQTANGTGTCVALGGSQPTATAAGQVPTSTGAGTTYTAQAPSASNLATGTVPAARLPVFDPKRLPGSVVNSVGVRLPNWTIVEAGNSTVAAAGNRIEGAMSSRYMPRLQYRTASGAGALTCSTTSCTLNIPNSDGFFNVGDYVTDTAYTNACLVSSSWQLTATTTTSITFNNNTCGTLNAIADSSVMTNQWLECA